MPFTIKCAWCGTLIGVKETEGDSASTLSHGICPSCSAKVLQQARAAFAVWDGTERRRGFDRRNRQRRAATRNVAETLIVLKGIAWIDSEATERRQEIRREKDFKMVVNAILENTFK
jgi:DNA-directed RNA polymerase subunit RPC12/RpoP